MAKYTLLTDTGPREVKTIKGVVVFVDTGEAVPENLTRGFNHVLQGPTYKPMLLAQLTNTPLEFWRTADADTRDKALEILQTISGPLTELRNSKLKERFAKRARRANAVRWNKDAE